MQRAGGAGHGAFQFIAAYTFSKAKDDRPDQTAVFVGADDCKIVENQIKQTARRSGFRFGAFPSKTRPRVSALVYALRRLWYIPSLIL